MGFSSTSCMLVKRIIYLVYDCTAVAAARRIVSRVKLNPALDAHYHLEKVMPATGTHLGHITQRPLQNT